MRHSIYQSVMGDYLALYLDADFVVIAIRVMMTHCWINDKPLLSNNNILLFVSSFCSGELLLWDLSKESKEQYQTFGVGHSRIVFNISCDVAGTKIMTVSMDRQVKYTLTSILSNKKQFWWLKTAPVYCCCFTITHIKTFPPNLLVTPAKNPKEWSKFLLKFFVNIFRDFIWGWMLDVTSQCLICNER